MVKICSQVVPEWTLVAIYPWYREVWEKKSDEVITSGEVDPDYAFERKMPKSGNHMDADGSAGK